MKLCLTAVFLSIVTAICAQPGRSKVDSLKHRIAATAGVEKAQALYALATLYSGSDIESAIAFADHAFYECRKIKYPTQNN